jgi:hypothetical protein
MNRNHPTGDTLQWLASIERRLSRIEATDEQRLSIVKAVVRMGQYLLAGIVIAYSLIGKITNDQAADLLTKIFAK